LGDDEGDRDGGAGDDLKRKDFIAVANLTREQALSPKLAAELAKSWRRSLPLMQFLCEAMGAAF
jgi:uncharacterized protein (DUF2461 family)